MKVHSVHRTYRNVRKGAPMLFLRRLNAGLGFRLEDSFKRSLLFPLFPFFLSFFVCSRVGHVITQLANYISVVMPLPSKIRGRSVQLYFYLSRRFFFFVFCHMMTRCLNKFRQIILSLFGINVEEENLRSGVGN